MNGKLLNVAAMALLLVFGYTEVKTANPWKQMKKVEAAIKQPSFPNRVLKITDFHKNGDSLYTEAINNAITTCSQKGGGMVLVPKGTYLTAAIHMRSNVNLHLGSPGTGSGITT